MKKIITLFIVMIALLSCKSAVHHNGSSATVPESYVTIIKFTEGEYANHPIVSDYNGFVLIRGNKCTASEGSGSWSYDFPSLDDRTPYIALADGWYLIDWTWDEYPHDGKTILTGITWDEYNGESEFDSSTPHISGDLFQKKYIRVDQLVTYSYPNGDYPMFDFTPVQCDTIISYNEFRYYENLMGGRYTEWSYIPFLASNGKCLCNRVEELDNLWDLIRKQLTDVINNGDIDNLPAPDTGKLLEGWW